MDDKKRNKNFTRQELEVLVEEISTRKKVLLGKLDNNISMHNKRHAWERVAEAVSAVTNSARDADGVRKKWADLKSAVKNKQKVTGGGSPSIILDAFEEKILSVIGDAAVTGVKSGMDTEKAPLEPEMNLSQILLDGNPSLCQTPKPKRFRTEEMIDIQTRLLKEVAALRKVQEELLQVERERLAKERETLEIKTCKL
ncbi:Myb/SANT-like DNA-binding domain-containing protein 4 [Anabarilius grahami]|uniref:Myb/SANT-like DNA-binding domain-containing protein 4 n=1 Tax=Anabarilius grahami TaxID=495550 RepID=A0A3N0YMG0_ANAGA|nr:Myb/SANT-like DNA-binding domain-containing protein 4 [Anabarilius grahami]